MTSWQAFPGVSLRSAIALNAVCALQSSILERGSCNCLVATPSTQRASQGGLPNAKTHVHCVQLALMRHSHSGQWKTNTGHAAVRGPLAALNRSSIPPGDLAAIHASCIQDLFPKAELHQAIVDCILEHPSEVQQKRIPQEISGTDALCQAKSDMGKTAVSALACLQQLDASDEAVKTLVICLTRELDYHIKHEFNRFAHFLLLVGQCSVSIPQSRQCSSQQAPCNYMQRHAMTFARRDNSKDRNLLLLLWPYFRLLGNPKLTKRSRICWILIAGRFSRMFVEIPWIFNHRTSVCMMCRQMCSIPSFKRTV